MDATLHPQWLERLAEFNLRVARHAHAMWFPQPLRSIVDAADAAANARIEPQASAWLLQLMGLERSTDWQMHEPFKRLFLLDRSSLLKLTRELSVAMHRDWLARVIDGARLRSLQARVEPSAWRFAVEDVPGGLFRHRSPTVDFDTGATEALTAMLERDGARILLALVPAGCRAVQRRARLRFDPATAIGVEPFAAERRDKALELICKHLIPRRLPQWAWLF